MQWIGINTNMAKRPIELQRQFDNLKKKFDNLTKHNYTVSAGWFDKEMSKIARIQEYGATITVTDKMRKFLAVAYGIYLKKETTTITIPPRPHRKQTINKFMKQWKKELAKLLLKTNYDLEKSLEILALKMAQDYKDIFSTGKFDALSSATLLIRNIKGIDGTAPLVATGEMQRTIKSEVTKR